MDTRHVFETSVSFADVDRDEVLLLPRLFKLLQEAAIRHANQFGAGTNALTLRGETWVLNRIFVQVVRYPRATETLRVETWSTGIRGFKGYRDFRVFDRAGETIVAGSSLWLYLNVATQGIVRVPREVAAIFPVGEEPPWCPDLEALALTGPEEGAARFQYALRYSDVDVNRHLNNAAYLDLVQSALSLQAGCPRPGRIAMKFAKGIAADARSATVALDSAPPRWRFSVGDGGVVCATGEALFDPEP